MARDVIYGVRMAPVEARMAIIRGGLPSACFATQDEAVDYIRQLQATQHANKEVAQVGEYKLAQTGFIFEIPATPELVKQCKNQPGVQLRFYNEPKPFDAVAAVIGRWSNYPRPVVVRGSHGIEKFHSRITDAMNGNAKAYEVPPPAPDPTKPPEHTVYGIVSYTYHCRPGTTRFDLNSFNTQTVPIFRTFDAAMTAIVQKQREELRQAQRTQNKTMSLAPSKDVLRASAAYAPNVWAILPINIEKSDWRSLSSKYSKDKSGALGTCAINPYFAAKIHGHCTGLPSVIIGKDDAMGARVIIPTSDSKDEFKQNVQDALQTRDAKLMEKAQANYQEILTARKEAAIPYQSRAEKSLLSQDQELPHPSETNAGWKLIERWSKMLNDKGYHDFAKELASTYNRNVDHLHDYNDETRRSAYKSMESVFGKVQRAAAKAGDFETATAAQSIARSASNALYDMQQESANTFTGLTREQAQNEYGVYIPEEVEV